MQIIYILVMLLACADLLVALYIYTHKSKAKALVCPMHGNCDVVVHSIYGRTLGIENTVLGMLFNIFMAAGLVFNYLFQVRIVGYFLEFWLMLVAITGALFSLFLMGVMVFKLKERCTWCIISATIVNTMAALMIINYLLVR